MLNVQPNGGAPGSFAYATCSDANYQNYDIGTLTQTITTCPGLTYSFTLSYLFSGDSYGYDNVYVKLTVEGFSQTLADQSYQYFSYINAFADGNYIFSVRNNAMTDSLGNQK